MTGCAVNLPPDMCDVFIGQCIGIRSSLVGLLDGLFDLANTAYDVGYC